MIPIVHVGILLRMQDCMGMILIRTLCLCFPIAVLEVAFKIEREGSDSGISIDVPPQLANS